MNEILLTNIFFIITGTVVVVLGILLGIILIKIMRMLTTASRIENKFFSAIKKIIQK